MATGQQGSDGATRVAYILGVPLAGNVVRQWPQMGEIVRPSRLLAKTSRRLPGVQDVNHQAACLVVSVVVELGLETRDACLYRNVTVGELENGRAVRVTDYWGEPTAIPEWRQSLTDRLDMPGDGIWPDGEHLRRDEGRSRANALLWTRGSCFACEPAPPVGL